MHAGLLATGQISTASLRLQGYFVAPALDPEADLTSWTLRLLAGEPYDGDPTVAAMRDSSYRWRSPIRVPLDRRPAAMILASGWADDPFGVDEMIRLRARIQAAWPDTPIGVYLADFGHQRTSNEQADVDDRNEWFLQLFEHELLGKGPRPGLGFRARPVTCPVGNGSGPRRSAPTWAALHPGEVRFSAPAPQTVSSLGGDPAVALEFTPLTANDPCNTVAASAAGPGTATYRLPAASGAGYTLMGAPTVIARLDVTGPNAQLAARLWDMSPDGRRLLVTRQVLRPRGGAAARRASRSSCSPPAGTSPRGTRSSWSCSAATRRTTGRPTAPSRSPCATSSCACRSPSARAPARSRSRSHRCCRPARGRPPTCRRLAARVTYPSCRAARIHVTGPAIRAVSVPGGPRDARRPFSLRVSRRSATLRVRATYADAPARTLRVRISPRCASS